MWGMKTAGGRTTGAASYTHLGVEKRQLGARAASLDALSPLKVLARGYSIAYGPSGVVTSAADVKPDDELRIRLADGDVRARALSVEKDNGDARPCATRDWR
nr:exodeoxyribonuclease VII large subunit [Collinsella ihumii]